MSVCVVTNTNTTSAELGVVATDEENVLGRADLDSRGHLAPVGTSGFEVGLIISLVLAEVTASLLVNVPDAAGLQPGSVRLELSEAVSSI